MTFCTLITWLALAVLILALLPWLLSQSVTSSLAERLKRYCDRLCKLWVVLAFLLGLVLGGILFCCLDEIRRWLLDSPTRRMVLLGLLLLLLLLYNYLIWSARCGIKQPSVTLGNRTIPLYWLIPVLALLILLAIWQCCGHGKEQGEPGWTHCHRLFLAAIALFILLAVLRYLAIRVCGDNKERDCVPGMRLRLWLILLLELLVLWYVRRNCGDLVGEKEELAMVGIWWQGQHEGETGAHLRWQFDIELLDFPNGGFDLQRRDSSSGAWANLNTERIRPATAWGDPAAVTGEMSRPQAVERLHPDSWAQFQDVNPDQQPFTDLLEMIGLAANDALYYVETPDPAVYATPPSNPYLTLAARQAYIDAYTTATATTRAQPLLVWDVEPLPFIMTTALHPEIARLIGLYFIDKTADPNVPHDYRVIGYWPDRQRSYTVYRISATTTLPLDPPTLISAVSPAPAGTLSGTPQTDDLSVALGWRPPDYNPNANLGVLDKIDSVLFHVENQRLETPADAVPDCTALTPGPTFQLVSRIAGDGQTLEPLPPAVPAPIFNPSTGLYAWPQFFFQHRTQEYGCYAYRIWGQDLFGRPSPTSGTRLVPVHDTTPPPAPVAVASRLVQREDATLTEAERLRFFPAGSTNNFALDVSWVWPEELTARAPDLHHFRISLHHNDLPGLLAGDWSQISHWDLAQLGPVVDASATSLLPARLASVGYDAADHYYEVVLDEDDLGTLASVGLSADDVTPVEYAYIGVSAVDHVPYQNQGPVSAPVTVFARDLIPPDPPPAPALSAGPFPADASGDRSLELAWTASGPYTYGLYRFDPRGIDVPPVVDPATIPAACFPAGAPVRPSGMSDEDWADLQARFALQVTAANHMDAFKRVSPLPLEPRGTEASFTDTVDATVSQLHVYAATATDRAGNESLRSCPSVAILVEDGVAPRAPVVRQVLGGDNSVSVSWTANPEVDLTSYAVYRTSVEVDAISRQRMVRIALLDPSGGDLTGEPAAPSAAVTGTGPYRFFTLVDVGARADATWYYRVEARDLSSNHSKLSEVAAGKAFDGQPPPPPVWAEPAASVNTSGQVVLAWLATPGERGLRVQIQRQQSGSPLWRAVGGWSAPDALQATDPASLDPGAAYLYRIRSMDGAGNRSDWSIVVEFATPGP